MFCLRFISQANLISSAAWLLNFSGRVHQRRGPRLKKKKPHTLHFLASARAGSSSTEIPRQGLFLTLYIPLSLWIKLQKRSDWAGSLQAFSGGFPVRPGFSGAGKSTRIAFVPPWLYSCFPASLKQKRHGQHFLVAQMNKIFLEWIKKVKFGSRHSSCAFPACGPLPRRSGFMLKSQPLPFHPALVLCTVIYLKHPSR